MYLLIAYNTDARYPNDIRWREYTGSKRRADQFAKIPKLCFTDSGHGIVFMSSKHRGAKLKEIREVTDYVAKKLRRVQAIEKQEKQIERQKAIWRKAAEAVEALGVELDKLKIMHGMYE